MCTCDEWGVKTVVLKCINFLILGKIVDGLLVMRKIEVSLNMATSL